MKAEGHLAVEDGCSSSSTGLLRAGEGVGLVRTAIVSHSVIMVAARTLTDDESFIVNLHSIGEPLVLVLGRMRARRVMRNAATRKHVTTVAEPR